MWTLDYTLQQAPSSDSYNVTGSDYAGVTGLRNLTGEVNADGT